MIERDEGWVPVGGSPVGVITWFVPDGAAVAVCAAWLAVIAGRPPELRGGCSGSGWCGHFPAGSDFAVNLFADPHLPPLAGTGPGGGAPMVLDPSVPLVPGRLAHAPLLAGCALQIECGRGRLISGDWEPELAGDILLLHRGGLFLDPDEHADFCALKPLLTIVPS